MGQSQAAGVDSQTHEAHCHGAAALKKHPTSHTTGRVKAPAKGGDVRLAHGFATHPGTQWKIGGNLSWQTPPGSSRPINTGSPSFAGTLRHWQFTHVLSMRSTVAGRAQRTRSAMSGGLRGDFGGAFELCQLRPDAVPVVRAQIPAANHVVAFALNHYGQFGAGFALAVVDRLPRCKLVEVDGADADLCSERRHAAVWQ